MKAPLLLLPLLCLSSPASAATLAGLWEFSSSTNPAAATVGNDLIFVGTSPTYLATLADDSATSLSGVITTVGGTANYLQAIHGIDPANSPGSFVSQYSIVMDIFSPAASRSSWRAIFQTNTTNSNDADYFIRNSNDTLGVNGLGTSGSNGYSTSPIDETLWTRLVITVDLSLAGGDVKTYLNGSLFYTHPANPTLTGTYALDPTVLFFADENNENAPLHVGVLAIYDGTLSPQEVAALGVAGAPVPEPSAALLGSIALLGLLRRRR